MSRTSSSRTVGGLQLAGGIAAVVVLTVNFHLWKGKAAMDVIILTSIALSCTANLLAPANRAGRYAQALINLLCFFLTIDAVFTSTRFLFSHPAFTFWRLLAAGQAALALIGAWCSTSENGAAANKTNLVEESGN